MDESESCLTIPCSEMCCYGGVWAYGDDERKYFGSTYMLDAMRKAIWRAEVKKRVSVIMCGVVIRDDDFNELYMLDDDQHHQ